jgi:hypothetical protein
MEFPMKSTFCMSALVAASLLQGGIASAQTLDSPGTAGTVVTPNGNSAVGGTTTTGSSAAGANRPATTPPAPVPSVGSTPYNSLPGDNPAAPGFPGKVGR